MATNTADVTEKKHELKQDEKADEAQAKADKLQRNSLDNGKIKRQRRRRIKPIKRAKKLNQTLTSLIQTSESQVFMRCVVRKTDQHTGLFRSHDDCFTLWRCRDARANSTRCAPDNLNKDVDELMSASVRYKLHLTAAMSLVSRLCPRKW
jgi:hypothetical protein